MKTYGQYCPLAKSLDLVGDRWALLVIRELILLGPSRYTDLKRNLPGVDPNVLAERLRGLEAAGLIAKTASPPPAPAALFALTDRGLELEPVILALSAWGEPLLTRPVKTDSFRTHWLILLARHHLADHAPWGAPVTIAVKTGDATMLIEVAGGEIRARLGDAGHPHATLAGSPPLIAGVLRGGMTLNDAAAWGVRFEGDPGALRRVQPAAGDGTALQQGLFPA